MIQTGYGQGSPDIVVMKDVDVAIAVFACKAYTLSPSKGSTKQRKISRDDIQAEYRYARREKVPLILAVKNLLTNNWWMLWVSENKLDEFSGISTPVSLAEDNDEARTFLAQSMQSVKEKLQSIMKG